MIFIPTLIFRLAVAVIYRRLHLIEFTIQTEVLHSRRDYDIVPDIVNLFISLVYCDRVIYVVIFTQ